MGLLNTGERIREIRVAAGLSQEQLAELSSLNRVTIAKYETGRVEPGAQALSRIADALDVSVDVLLGRSEEPEESPKHIQTVEAQIISDCVNKMPQTDRARALSLFKAVYADYFNDSKEKNA